MIEWLKVTGAGFGDHYIALRVWQKAVLAALAFLPLVAVLATKSWAAFGLGAAVALVSSVAVFRVDP
jgi:hypothetical protein